MTHPMARDEFEHLVAGDRLETTIGQFKLRAARIIEEEQAKASPDNMLISFACDAIRFAREHGTFYHTLLDTAADRLERRKPANYEETQASRTEVELGSAKITGSES